MIRVQRAGTAFPSVYNTLNQPNTTHLPVRSTTRPRVGIRPMPGRPSTDFGNKRQSLVVVPDKNRDRYGTSMGATLEERAASRALRPAELGYHVGQDELFRASLPAGASARLGQSNLINLIRNNIRANQSASAAAVSTPSANVAATAPASGQSLISRIASAAGSTGLAGASLAARAAGAAGSAGMDLSARAFRAAYLNQEESEPNELPLQNPEPEWQDPLEFDPNELPLQAPPPPPQLGQRANVLPGASLLEGIRSIKLKKPKLANEAISGGLASEAKMEEPEESDYIIYPSYESGFFSDPESSFMIGEMEENPFDFEMGGKKSSPVEEPKTESLPDYRYVIKSISDASTVLRLYDKNTGKTILHSIDSPINMSDIDLNIEDPMSKKYARKDKQSIATYRRRVKTYMTNIGKKTSKSYAVSKPPAQAPILLKKKKTTET